MDPGLAHMQYMHPSGMGHMSSDGGFAGLGPDNEDVSGTQPEDGLRLWEAKYQFQKDMLPMFVGEAFGRKVRVRGGWGVEQPALTGGG